MLFKSFQLQTKQLGRRRLSKKENRKGPSAERKSDPRFQQDALLGRQRGSTDARARFPGRSWN